MLGGGSSPISLCSCSSSSSGITQLLRCQALLLGAHVSIVLVKSHCCSAGVVLAKRVIQNSRSFVYVIYLGRENDAAWQTE